MPRKPGGVISQELKGFSLLPSWSAKGCWGAFARLYWGVLGFWGSWGAGGRGCGGSAQWRLHSCNEGDTVQPLAGTWFLLGRLCPEQVETREERGWSEIVAFCQSQREKETLSPPQGRAAGGQEVLWLTGGGRRPPHPPELGPPGTSLEGCVFLP